MKKLAIGLMLILFLSETTVQAQVTDPEQRKSWFYLQKLATEAKEAEGCMVVAIVESQEAFNETSIIYKQRVEEFVGEVDRYITKYVNQRSKEESLAAFRFRIWRVPIEVGAEEAKKANEVMCRTLRLAR